MPMQTGYQDLFVTRIWTFKLPEMIEHHELWKEKIDEMMAAQPEPCGRSNRLGWNSETRLFEKYEDFKPLHSAVASCFNHVFNELGVADDLQYRMEAWVNLTYPHGYNVKHVHSGCLLSACYYVDVPPNSGELAFHDPRSGSIFSPLKTDSKQGALPQKTQPYSGLLVIFPSWLEHSVEPNLSDKPRISIPVNAVPVK